jgi:hypothetical protein
MSQISSLGIERPQLSDPLGGPAAIRSKQQVLKYVLSFAGFTIHDVVNSPIARNAVAMYFRLYREVERNYVPVEYKRRPGRIEL